MLALVIWEGNTRVSIRHSNIGRGSLVSTRPIFDGQFLGEPILRQGVVTPGLTLGMHLLSSERITEGHMVSFSSFYRFPRDGERQESTCRGSLLS